MSATKRRARRKINHLVRMVTQVMRYWRLEHMPRRDRLLAATKALGRRIHNTGLEPRARAAVQHLIDKDMSDETGTN